MFNLKTQRPAKSKTWKRWWLFNATDFESLMYPYFIFCRIFGVFPYKLKASTFNISKPHYILSTVVNCFYCFWDLMIIQYLVINSEDVTKTLNIVCYFMLSGFIVLNTHVLSGARMRVLQTILEVSSKLPPESYQKLSRVIHAINILVIILLILDIYNHFSKTKEGQVELNWDVIIVVAFEVHSAVIEVLMNTLYINCICVLKACFQRINDNLAHMQQHMIKDMKGRDPKLIYHLQRNQFLLTELKNQQKQHLMVGNAVQMLNVTFSVQLLITAITTFTSITFDLYFYVMHWEDGIFISLDRYFLDMILMSVAYNVTKIALIVWACETGKNRAEEIGITIHDLLNTTKDEQIKKELQLFSLQILHRKNIFSAKGFTMDATFLATLTANITTYLIILAQFLSIWHSCDKKTAINVIQSNEKRDI